MKIDGENVKIYIGKVEEEDDVEMGPQPKPDAIKLRSWDKTLLERYKPQYNPISKSCLYCGFGPCDLSANRKGACGIDLKTHTAREALFLAITGTASHTSHGRHMLDHVMKTGGKDRKISVAENTEVLTPVITLVTGLVPKKVRDLEEPLQYVEKELSILLSSLHYGQESDNIDFESKSLHAGMLDLVGMEIADVLQTSVYDFPKGERDPALVDIGFGTIDTKKPVILCIGHNVVSGVGIIDYAIENNADVEVAGLCCTAHDLARYSKSAKVVGPLSSQIPFVRSGKADVIVLDEQCIRLDNIKAAEELGIPVITTSDKNVGGFDDITDSNADDIVKSLLEGIKKGVFISDPEKAGEVAVKVAIKVHKKGKKKPADRISDVEKCTSCGLCTKACPIGLDAMRMITTIRNKHLAPGEKVPPETLLAQLDTTKNIVLRMLKVGAYSPTELAEELNVSRQYIYNVLDSLGKKLHKTKRGKEAYYCLDKSILKDIEKGKQAKRPFNDKELLKKLNSCLFCGRCESWCPVKIRHVSVYSEILGKSLHEKKAKLRTGRGPIQDVEIREVGRPIVFGEIPGVIAPVGCPAFPNGQKEISDMTKTFLDRGFIVTASGCTAMVLGTEGDLYEKYEGVFDRGNLLNLGSCVADAHIAGAAIKIASIFAKRNLNANFEEIADYVLNRIGAVGIVWGTYTQKAFSIATGCNRLGIPVILGPFGKKYRRDLRSDENTDWSVYDTKSKEKYNGGPCPEHLFYTAETIEEAMVMAVKLCMRSSDGVKGRMIKLANWLDLYEKHYGGIPEDFHRFVRTETDLPMTNRAELLKILKKQGWSPQEKIPDPTLLKRLSGGG